MAVAFNLMTLLVHQNQYLVDIGFSQGFAALMLASIVSMWIAAPRTARARR